MFGYHSGFPALPSRIDSHCQMYGMAMVTKSERVDFPRHDAYVGFLHVYKANIST